MKEGTGPLGDMGDLYLRMETELQRARDELGRQTVEVVVGEGVVRVVMSGTQVCERVAIQMEGLHPEHARRLEELLREAVNRAVLESQKLAARRIGPFAKEGG
jgi:DNA-binding protein YbaB